MPKKGLPTDFESFLTWEALVSILSYDPATGEFRWIGANRLGWKNRLAGSVDQGYRRIEILGRSFFASRLAYLYMTKRWPRGLIDHKNGDRGDDRWVNLRDVSRLQNRRNVFPYIEVPARETQIAVEPIARPTKKSGRRGVASDHESFLTHDVVVSMLSYDPATGVFVWRSNVTNPTRIKVGQIAGKFKVGQYSDIQIMGRKFRAHRLAWLYMTGKWPVGDVDHKNGEKSDNSWANLHLATRSQNAFNQRRKKNGASGIRGVYQHGKKWRVIIGHQKVVRLGTFATKDEAENVRLQYEREHFGEFSNSKKAVGG